LDGLLLASLDPNRKGIEMKPIVFALSCALLTLAGCSTPGERTSEPQRTELQPGYWDPK
jgi:hypothetical protein